MMEPDADRCAEIGAANGPWVDNRVTGDFLLLTGLDIVGHDAVRPLGMTHPHVGNAVVRGETQRRTEVFGLYLVVDNSHSALLPLR